MKKIYLGLGLLLMNSFTKAQNGVDSIIVEKYYISNAADAAGSFGTLPAGSVTYRLFLDMAPNYSLQALFGKPAADNVTPLHPLKIKTTTAFFNNTDRGAEFPNNISSTRLNANTVAIDSWFAFSGTCNNQVGVLKSADDGVANLIQTGRSASSVGVLANTDTDMGILLTAQDGMIAGTPGSVGFIGTGAQETTVFGATSQAGSSFVVDDGSVYYQGSIAGVDPATTNRILIGQFTTDGVFTYEINVQVKSPGGVVEDYLAKSPSAATGTNTAEYLLPKGTSGNASPSITITSPIPAATYTVGDNITITADAMDSDGSIASVEFFVDAASIGVDASSPYSASWTGTAGTHTITATATDNLGSKTPSKPISVSSATVTGIKNLNSNTSFSIYPNPANNIINIEINIDHQFNNAEYTLFDIIGNPILNKKLGTISGSYNEVVDVSGFSKGLYIVKFSSNDFTVTKKIVIN